MRRRNFQHRKFYMNTDEDLPWRQSKAKSLTIVLIAYVFALAAGWTTLVLAPVDHVVLRTLAADVVATLVIFAFSVACSNSSLYDAYWSVIPIAIVVYWIMISAESAVELRMLLLLIVVVAWGVRLTLNWARSWAGLTEEDWRYVDFRQSHPRVYWLISFSGLHFFPTLIVFAGLAAAWPVFDSGGRAMGWLDGLAFCIGLTGIGLESVADHQLRRFAAGRAQPGDIMETGLWRYSRHPNYLGEILVWWSLYLFGWAADPEWAKWALLAPIAMTSMFVFKTIPMIEKRSLARRPGYQRIIDETPMLIPLPRSRQPVIR